MRRIFSEVDAVARLAPKAPAQKLRSDNFSLRVGHGLRPSARHPPGDVPGLAGRARGRDAARHDMLALQVARWIRRRREAHEAHDATSKRLRMLMAQAARRLSPLA
jgi:hypothetical protein